MKILFAVHQFFPLCYTGTERLVLNLCKQMQKMGHRVTVLTYAIGETEGFVERCGVLIKEYEYQGVPVIAIRHKKIPDLVNFSIFDDELADIMEDLLSKEQYDILHVCHSMRIGEVIKSARKKGIPIILTLTDFWLMCPQGIAMKRNGSLCVGSNDGLNCMMECYPGDNWKNRIIERFHQTKGIFSYASGVVSATRFLKLMFENQGYIRDIAIIRFGKDYRYIRKKEKKYFLDSKITIGYLSSLNPHKGAHILLKAFMQVNPENIRVKIYGDPQGAPYYFDILQNISKGHPNIEFCGRYDYEEMPKIFDEIDMIAVPSIWWENSPLVLLRALAHGVPAITSDLGGLTEVITDGQDGFTFTLEELDSVSDNPKNLSNIIKKISKDPRILNDLKAKIKSPPRIEEEAFEYECLYQKIVSLKSTGSPEGHTSFEPIKCGPVMQDAKIDSNEHPASLFRQKYGSLFVEEIHTNDAMYRFLVNHPDIKDPLGEYFQSGESMITTLNEILLDQKIDIQSLKSFLDFASGYGRFTRFLTSIIPAERIAVCDIDKQAVDFCEDKFGVDGYYSSEDPNNLTIRKKFDVIWVASLFSHLSRQVWMTWLTKLSGLLNPGGILIFSTHGCHCFNMLDEPTKRSVLHQDHGFYFIGKSEIDALPNDIYGTTYVTEKFVREFIDKNSLGTIVGYYPKKLWAFQDLYVMKKDLPPQPNKV